MDDSDDLSAFVDGELTGPARARVEDRLTRDVSARRRLAELQAVRRAVAAIPATPASHESARLDAAVWTELDRHGSRPVQTTRAGRHRVSPRKRGRPAWPYFAVAAGIAAVLSLTLVLVVQTLGGNVTSSDVAEAPPQTSSQAPEASAADEYAEAPAQEQPAPVPDIAAAPAPASPQYSRGPELPQLYLSDIAVTELGQLASLLAAAPPVPSTAALADLAAVASAAGADDLARCLDSVPPDLVPARVDSGSFAGEPAWFLTVGPAGGTASAVLVLAASTCSDLGRWPPP